MKIAVLGTRGFPNVQGGIERHCEELYTRLAEMGCEITVFGRAPYIGVKPYRYRGVSVVPVGCPKHKFLETGIHTFQGVVRAFWMQPDILHIHGIGPSLFVPLARMLGMRVVVTHHGPDYNRQKWNAAAKTVLRVGEAFGARYAHRVIAISRGIASSLRKKFHCAAGIIANGVGIRNRVPAAGVLLRHGLTAEKYIMAVGRFVPEKGFDYLLDSYGALPEATRSGYKLVIVGDADHADVYSRKLKEKAATVPGAVLTGVLGAPELAELYSNTALFVLPSFHEGLPIVLLEAMSFGAACLASAIPANQEVELTADRFFAPGNRHQLTEKLSVCLQRPLTALERKRQLAQVANVYNWDAIAASTLDVYTSLIKQHIRFSLPAQRIPAQEAAVALSCMRRELFGMTY